MDIKLTLLYQGAKILWHVFLDDAFTNNDEGKRKRNLYRKRQYKTILQFHMTTFQNGERKREHVETWFLSKMGTNGRIKFYWRVKNEWDIE